MTFTSGDQFKIEKGSLRATVTEVGASLRRFDDGDRPIIWGYDKEEIASGGRGQVLCPWPNRLEDGTYTFDDVTGSASLNEPERHNAIHGLVRWLEFRPIEVTSSSVRLAAVVVPQPAYPFRLAIEIAYELGDEGLRVSSTLRNEDQKRLPVGLGFHPYFAPGPSGLDDANLFVAARSHLVLDNRGLPISTEAAANSSVAGVIEGNSAGSLRELVLDDCFTDLQRDDAGRWTVRFLTGPDGPERVIWGDQAFTHVMCFTGDTLAGELFRHAIAIEPMTCAPNALHTGEGLHIIEPGESFTCEWGVRTG